MDLRQRGAALRPRAAFLAAAALLAAAGTARANGRTPATQGVQVTPGQDERIVMPVTFGLMISSDDGATFHWVCEAAIGYSGTFDPEYVVLPGGDIVASTEHALRRSRDGGCTFETVAADVLGADAELSEVELGADGRLWVGTKTAGAPNDFWVSEDGETFTSGNLAEDDVWWFSLRATAANPLRLYVSGLRPADPDAGTPATPVIRRTDDGGATWSDDLPVEAFELGADRSVLLLGVSPTEPDVLYARTPKSIVNVGDILYRSADGGTSWVEVARYDLILSAFHISPDGQKVIAGSPFPCPGDPELPAGGAAPNGCVRVSDDGGETWRRAAEEPRLNCLGARGDGTLFGCASNSIDEYALGRSTDGESWEPFYRFQDTVGPLECPAGTAQAECADTTWPMICRGASACPAPDAGPVAPDSGAGGGESDGGGGCCRVGGRAAIDGGWIPALAVALVLARRRRR